MTRKFLQAVYQKMNKVDWKELAFRDPTADEERFLSQLFKKPNVRYPVPRGTAVETYGYTAPGWQAAEMISLIIGEGRSVPDTYYAVVRINGSDIITETLCMQKETKNIHAGDDIILIRKTENRAYAYKFI